MGKRQRYTTDPQIQRTTLQHPLPILLLIDEEPQSACKRYENPRSLVHDLGFASCCGKLSVDNYFIMLSTLKCNNANNIVL